MDWNSSYVSGETPWDKGEPAPPLVDYLKSHTLEGRILVPGCGRGHDVRFLASQGCEVTGMDISAQAIRDAQAFPRTGNEAYVCADLFEWGVGEGALFDGVVEHTCFCALPKSRRAAYVNSLTSLLKPGGWLLGIFFVEVNEETEEHPPWAAATEELDMLFGDYFLTLDRYVADCVYKSRRESVEEVRLMKRITAE